MAYEIVFTGSAEEAFDGLESDERSYIQKKLDEIASSEFRHPPQWDFKPIGGRSDGWFRVGNGLRVFADINGTDNTICVHRAAQRENLY
ncbi:type II toxin-antitoxin system RelE family toxin [Natrinema sp. JCM 9743]